MRTTIFTEPIWPCIGAALDYLVAKREEPAPKLVQSGLNFSILLGSACYAEGVLEALLRALLHCRGAELGRIEIADYDLRRAKNFYYARLEDELSRNIARAVGAQGYDEIFTLLTGLRLSQLKEVKPIWEGVTVLFNFRNVLGHGRQVWARHTSGAPVQGGFKEDFSGGYRAVEDYLHKKRLLTRRFVEADSEYLFLSAPIADHFFALAKALPGAVVSSLSTEEQTACRKALEDVENAPWA